MFNHKIKIIILNSILLIVFNIVISLFMFLTLDDEDFNGMSGTYTNKKERFINFFYYNIVSTSSTGYGDITPKSPRARIFVSLILLSMTLNFFATLGLLY